MRRPIMIVLLFLALGAASASADNRAQTTVLLTPSGLPVGGVWQRWMNDSRMPTYQGPMVLDLAANATDCGAYGVWTVDACTSGTGITPEAPQVQGMPETVVNMGALIGRSRPVFLRNAHRTLLYEQAHVVDQFVLTDPERAQFAAMWGRPVPAGVPVDQWWWQGETTNPFGTLGEWFANDYMICAVWPKLTWKILDANATTGWDGAAPISLPPLHVFPVLNDWRTPSALIVNGHYKRTIALPASKRQRLVFRTQTRSCGLIASWITG